MRLLKIFVLLLISGTAFSQSGAAMMMTTTATGETYLLDDYPADAAYSLRLLKADHLDSAAIRVRRSSDNAEQDIGFTSQGYLDTASMKTFVGANSGYVVTWYDQSGNENDATQSTAASQPRIINAGVIERLNSKPAIKFDGSDDDLNASYISNTSHSIFTVFDVTNLESDGVILNQNGSVGDFLFRKNLYGVRFFDAFTDIDVVSPSSVSGQNLISIFWDGELPLTPYIPPPTGTLSGFQNGSLVDNTAQDNNFTTTDVGLLIGWDNIDSGTRFDQTLQEIVFYTSDQSANRTAIETEINGHYSIY